MLSSIHPLGERARRSRWGITAGFYLAGAALAGAALGGALGLTGAALDGLLDGGTAWVAAVAVAACLAGAALDLGIGGLSVPSLLPRQVDDGWLHRYRGWVYGAGFGAQLGLGVVTFVTTGAVYATWLLALLSASPAAGALIGLAFGAGRGAVIFTMAGARDPASLRRAHRRLEAWAAPARRLAATGQAVVGVVVLGVVL